MLMCVFGIIVLFHKISKIELSNMINITPKKHQYLINNQLKNLHIKINNISDKYVEYDNHTNLIINTIKDDIKLFNRNLYILGSIIYNCHKELSKFKSLEQIETKQNQQNINYDFNISSLMDRINILNEKITKYVKQDDFDRVISIIDNNYINNNNNINNSINKIKQLYENIIAENFNKFREEFTNIKKTINKSNCFEQTSPQISPHISPHISSQTNEYITKKQLEDFSHSIGDLFQTNINNISKMDSQILNINKLIEEKNLLYITKKHLSKYNSNLTEQFNDHLKLIESLSDDIKLLKTQMDIELNSLKTNILTFTQTPRCDSMIVPIIVGYKYTQNGRSHIYDKTLYANTYRTQLIINLLPSDYKISKTNNYITNSPNDTIFGLSYYSQQPEQQIHYDILEDSISLMKDLKHLEINKLGKNEKETKILNQYSVPFNLETISHLPIETLILNGIWLNSINGIENMKNLKVLHLENQDLLDNISNVLQNLPNIKCTIKNCPALVIDSNIYKMQNITFI
jgi:hypothetical protein